MEKPFDCAVEEEIVRQGLTAVTKVRLDGGIRQYSYNHQPFWNLCLFYCQVSSAVTSVSHRILRYKELLPALVKL